MWFNFHVGICEIVNFRHWEMIPPYSFCYMFKSRSILSIESAILARPIPPSAVVNVSTIVTVVLIIVSIDSGEHQTVMASEAITCVIEKFIGKDIQYTDLSYTMVSSFAANALIIVQSIGK